MLDNQKRLKSVQWLNKWDEFRQVKSQYVDKALELLKDKRRVINIIALIHLVQKMKDTRENYAKRRAYMKAQFTAILLAIRMKVKYQHNF